METESNIGARMAELNKPAQPDEQRPDISPGQAMIPEETNPVPPVWVSDWTKIAMDMVAGLNALRDLGQFLLTPGAEHQAGGFIHQPPKNVILARINMATSGRDLINDALDRLRDMHGV